MIDLRPEHLATVKRILEKHAPGFEVRAFGSRVTGKAKEASDLDLALMTRYPLEAGAMADLKEAFSESNLPFKVDVVDWAATKGNFRKIIEEKSAIICAG